jgi:hypothetical protein
MENIYLRAKPKQRKAEPKDGYGKCSELNQTPQSNWE